MCPHICQRALLQSTECHSPNLSPWKAVVMLCYLPLCTTFKLRAALLQQSISYDIKPLTAHPNKLQRTNMQHVPQLRNVYVDR